jgi:hypothetical protein
MSNDLPDPAGAPAAVLAPLLVLTGYSLPPGEEESAATPVGVAATTVEELTGLLAR